jgi:hypothetical protein
VAQENTPSAFEFVFEKNYKAIEAGLNLTNGTLPTGFL